LVYLILHEGLVEKNHLHFEGNSFFQIIYYEQLPFQCHRCHKHGHLAKDFPLGISQRKQHRGVNMNVFWAQIEQLDAKYFIQMYEVGQH